MTRRPAKPRSPASGIPDRPDAAVEPLSPPGWFGVWMFTATCFLGVLPTTAESTTLTASVVNGLVVVLVAFLGTAAWLASGPWTRRRLGWVAAFVGTFALATIPAVAWLASTGVRAHRHLLLGACVVVFWLVTVRTLVAMVVEIRQGSGRTPSS